MAPAGAPDWARDRQALWQAVEAAERRKDAQLARELLVTLPRDVPLAAAIDRLRTWVRFELVVLGKVADVCVHAYGTPLDPNQPEHARRLTEIMQPGAPVYDLPRGAVLPQRVPDGPHAWRLHDGRVLVYQPHAHVLTTTRTIGPDGFGKKAREWGAKAQLYRWRQSWEDAYNALLAGHGLAARVTSKARWKREADDAVARGVQPDAGWAPVEVDLGGGYHAALDGRPPRDMQEGQMSGADWNARVRAMRAREVAAEADSEDRTARALARVRELQRDGVRFKRTDKGGLGYDDPQGRVTADDRRLWSGLHAVVLDALAADAARARAATPDARLEAAMTEIRRLQAAGVTFGPTKAGALGYKDPDGAVTPDVYRQFSGLHAAILARLERDRLKVERARLKADAERAARMAEDAARRATERDDALERERAHRARVEQQIDAVAAAARTGAALPERPTTPLVARVVAAVTSLRQGRAEAEGRAQAAEARAGRLTDTLRKVARWLAEKAPGIARALTGVIRAALPPEDAADVLEESPGTDGRARSVPGPRPPTSDGRYPVSDAPPGERPSKSATRDDDVR
jgi:hypothetical protein